MNEENTKLPSKEVLLSRYPSSCSSQGAKALRPPIFISDLLVQHRHPCIFPGKHCGHIPTFTHVLHPDVLHLLPLGIAYTMRQPQKVPGSVSLGPKSPCSPSTTLKGPNTSYATSKPLQAQKTGVYLSSVSPPLILKQGQIDFLRLSSCLSLSFLQNPKAQAEASPRKGLR